MLYKIEEPINQTRSSKDIQERMFKNRVEKLKLRGGFTPEELINMANNPKRYR